MSHEFRTPLTAILGLAATLEAAPETTAGLAGDFAGRIHRQGRRLQQLVENLLEAERPLDPVSGACDAAAVVDASVALAMEAQRDARPVLVDVTPGLALPLPADAAQLVLMNLVGNAAKFASAATPVSVRVQATDDGGVVIEVENHGPTIPDQLQARIFEPFVQGDSSMTRGADGVGLGLHIIHRVVTNSGGRVGVNSRDGITTFVVWLAPVAVEVAAAAVRVEASARQPVTVGHASR